MKKDNPYVLVLGIAQDGGYPHAGCYKDCCNDAWKNPLFKKHVSCLAIVDPISKEKWIIEATPDIREQLFILNEVISGSINGILLTHAHIGHYTGLIHLGKEAMNTKRLPVFAAPLMKRFLKKNQPWKKLSEQNNIRLISIIQNSKPIQLNKRIKVTPFPVPHRDELSETMGFRIEGNNNSVVYIPDIDNWKKWESKLENIILSAGRVYIDGTFYDKNEIPKRNLSKIPHPFITDTIELLKSIPLREKEKVHFIHLNHTNPALKTNSQERRKIEKYGFQIAEEMSRFNL